jgi:hypothetical protein
MRQRWEYLALACVGVPGPNTLASVQQYGAEGWELVGFPPIIGTGIAGDTRTQSVTVWFKRPLMDSTPYRGDLPREESPMTSDTFIIVALDDSPPHGTGDYSLATRQIFDTWNEAADRAKTYSPARKARIIPGRWTELRSPTSTVPSDEDA